MGFTKEEIERSNKYIRVLYGRRCIRCGKPNSGIIHEITPRSVDPAGWIAISNRVLLCGGCHEFIHQRGAMNFVDELRECQARVLGLAS